MVRTKTEKRTGYTHFNIIHPPIPPEGGPEKDFSPL